MSRFIASVRSLAFGFISLALLFSAGRAHATESVGPMATGRSSHVAIPLQDGRALLAGGFLPSSASATSSAEIFDPATGLFSPTASLATARARAAAARLADGRVLVAGGTPVNSSPSAAVASAEIYDPVAGTWTTTGAMGVAREGAAALALPSGMVLVIAGDPSGTVCELYDPATGTFAATGALGVSRANFVASVLQDGRVLVAGGGEPAGPSKASAEIWNPVTGTWSATGSMSAARADASATTLGDGKVLVVGGSTAYSWSSIIASAELYDPAAGAFSATGSLSVGRSSHAAALLGDGNVIVSGGYSAASSLLASVERYDVAARVWQSVGSMAAPRAKHTESTLLSGNVLIAGGSGLTAAEIVDPGCVPAMPTISPGSANFPFGGGTGSVSVTYAAGCGWRVANVPSWVTITSGTQGEGSAAVTYSVAENTTSLGRGATLSIADNPFMVNQPANPCANTTLSPASQSFGYAGGSGSMTLSAGASCAWTVSGVPQWVTLAVSSGTGSASISYTVATNPGAARSATMSIAGRNITVSQAANACVPAPTISPASRSFTVNGGTSTVAITAPVGCAWTVTGVPSWITMTQSGSGNATLSVTAAANAGAERSATFSVAGNSFAVTQAANLCADATLSPTSASFTANAGTGTIALTAAPACTWNVGGVPSWVTVTSGTSGAGSATIAYSVTANSAAARSATLTIAGRSFAVSQAAAACYPAPVISPSTLSFTAAAGNGTGSVNVLAPAGCSWAVTGVPAWVTVTSPLSGAGNGVVSYSVQANVGSARSATMVIANVAHTVSQSAPGTATLPTGRMLAARASHAAATLADGRVLVSGGFAASGGFQNLTATAEIYDPGAGTFSATGSLLEARTDHTSVRLADGRVLVVGGVSPAAVRLATAEVYDLTTGTWAPTGSMSAARRNPLAVALPDGRVLVTGGESASGAPLASSEIFDPVTGTFTATGSTLTPRTGPAVAALPDGRVLLAGGWYSNSYLASAELWDPVSGTWTATGPMASVRGDGPSASVLTNGKVLVAGGYAVDGPAPAAEVYDPATGTFSLTGNFNRARSGQGVHRAVTLADGSVVATDSFGGIERYNVAAGTWQVVGQFSDSRTWYTASLLPNGKILVAGGFPGPLTSAELFDPAVCPAPATLSSTSQSFGGSGGSGSIAVTLTAGCPRTVSSYLPFWISASVSGSGSGTVTYSVAANNGAARSATFSIAGASFTVTQSAGGAASCGFAGSVSSAGTYSGTLASTDCTFGARGTSYYTDRYSFDAVPGQQVAFQLSSSAFDTYLYLKNPAGTVIASNDDGGGGTNSRIPATSGVFTLPAGTSGTYVIEVTSFSTGATGAYTLQRIQ